jgi:hypothetical protein
MGRCYSRAAPTRYSPALCRRPRASPLIGHSRPSNAHPHRGRDQRRRPGAGTRVGPDRPRMGKASESTSSWRPPARSDGGRNKASDEGCANPGGTEGASGYTIALGK